VIRVLVRRGTGRRRRARRQQVEDVAVGRDQALVGVDPGEDAVDRLPVFAERQQQAMHAQHRPVRRRVAVVDRLRLAQQFAVRREHRVDRVRRHHLVQDAAGAVPAVQFDDGGPDQVDAQPLLGPEHAQDRQMPEPGPQDLRRKIAAGRQADPGMHLVPQVVERAQLGVVRDHGDLAVSGVLYRKMQYPVFALTSR
jgi:hypothetical protein